MINCTYEVISVNAEDSTMQVLYQSSAPNHLDITIFVPVTDPSNTDQTKAEIEARIPYSIWASQDQANNVPPDLEPVAAANEKALNDLVGLSAVLAVDLSTTPVPTPVDTGPATPVDPDLDVTNIPVPTPGVMPADIIDIFTRNGLQTKAAAKAETF